MKQRLKLLVAVLLSAVLFTFTGCGKPEAGGGARKIKIGVSLPTQQEERWQRDAQRMKEVAAELGVILKMQISDNDAAKQMAQCENLFAQGIDILILTPHDATSAGSIVEKAHKIGLKVIAYDRIVMNCNLDIYISFDNQKVGELQGQYLTDRVKSGNYVVFGGAPTDNNAKLFRDGAMSKITPLVSKGDVKIVMDQMITDWQPTVAMNLMQNALTANNNKIDAVLAPNDNTAGGIIQALAQVGLAGKVPVTGQDAEITAARRIIEGTQTMTIFKDTRECAGVAINTAVQMVRGQTPNTTSKVNNNTLDVPSILLAPVVVDKSNLDQILIGGGYLRRDQVYKN